MDERTSPVSSMIGSMLNPFTAIKEQYFSVWAIPFTLTPAARTGAISYFPFFTPAMLFMKRVSYAGKALKDISLKSVVKGAFGGIHVTGGLPGVATHISNAMTIAADDAAKLSKTLYPHLRSYMKVTPLGKITSEGVFDYLVGKGQIEGARVTELLTKIEPVKNIGSMVYTSKVVSTIATRFNAALIGVTVGELLANAVTYTFKGSLAALNYANAKIEHMRALELGGQLGPGYRSSAAAGERQGAVQGLSRVV